MNLKAVVLGIVGLFLIAALAPAAITQIMAANTTSWGANNIALWGIVGTMAIIGIVLVVLGPALE
jgi:hypothetical protein